MSKAKGARPLCAAYLVHPFYACHPSDMSFSDFYPSDLTDITSSDDDDEEFTLRTVKRTGTKKSKGDQRSPYTITNPLRPPRSTSYSVRALYGPSFLTPSLSPAKFLSQNKSSMDRSTWIRTIKEVPVPFILSRREVTSAPCRYCLAGTKTGRSHRLSLS